MKRSWCAVTSGFSNPCFRRERATTTAWYGAAIPFVVGRAGRAGSERHESITAPQVGGVEEQVKVVACPRNHQVKALIGIMERSWEGPTSLGARLLLQF
jgi:hypothetical protein